jgi:hypothetical protein
MRLWDWIVLASVAEGTLALVLALLIQRDRRREPVWRYLEPRSEASSPVDEDEEGEDQARAARRPRRRRFSRARSGEASFRMVPLGATARERYLRQWRHLRAEFVEEPGRTTERTDDLVQDLMFDRGYSVEALDDPDLKVAAEHQVVAENYRIAHRLAAGARGAGTEQLRLAMLHFRVVLEELLEEPPYDAFPPKRKVRRKRKAGRPEPDVDRYRISVTDEGPESPGAQPNDRAIH